MEALIHPNTDTIVEKINEATKTGLIIGGKEHNFDAIICAVGHFQFPCRDDFYLLTSCLDRLLHELQAMFPNYWTRRAGPPEGMGFRASWLLWDGSGRLCIHALLLHRPWSLPQLMQTLKPNYFTLLGPNSPVGNGPLLIAIEGKLRTPIETS